MKNRHRNLAGLFLVAISLLALSACLPITPASVESGQDSAESDPTQPTDADGLEAQATAPAEPTQAPTTEAQPSESPTATSAPTDHPATAGCDDPFEGVSVRFSVRYWPETDFCEHSVDYSEFLSGGPPPDGIPAIDAPEFEPVSAADEWLGDEWPIMFFEWEGDARAYPLAILMWHEIVNDEVGGLPVTLTFCPLCNATIAFSRTLGDGTVLDFGTSGNLRKSDLVMYDRQTFSWWQQFTGTAIVGKLTGTQLEFLPSQIISWRDFKDNHPDGMVLSRNTGHARSYGRNPYVGYDNINSYPFLFDGVVDGRLAATERVVAVELNGSDVAYPFSEISAVGVVNDLVAEIPIAVFWKAGTNSALDAASFDEARDIGATAVFRRVVDGQTLSFVAEGDVFVDQETESTWNIFGEAVDGPLSGTRLEKIVAAEHFWFAWAAFKPETTIWTAENGD